MTLLIDEALVRRLLAAQFPQWAHFPIRFVEGGWDNRSFRIGDDYVARLPSAAEYAAQVEKEAAWLPKLAPALPLPIPAPVAIGEPTAEFPWRWSVNRWLEGHPFEPKRVRDVAAFASSLARFLRALERIEATGGPAPGAHSFHRGGPLLHYDAETRHAIVVLGSAIDAAAATRAWEGALQTRWTGKPAWVHGDISPGNLLVKEGRLCAVIDFGMLSAGDPACDLAIAWTTFADESRDAFRRSLDLDAGTWERGRAWALWKALIVAAGLTKTNAVEMQQPMRVIDEILSPKS